MAIIREITLVPATIFNRLIIAKAELRRRFFIVQKLAEFNEHLDLYIKMDDVVSFNKNDIEIFEREIEYFIYQKYNT